MGQRDVKVKARQDQELAGVVLAVGVEGVIVGVAAVGVAV